MPSVSARVDAFCRRFGVQVPVLLAPMAGVPSPPLSIAVAEAGGMGACGVLPMSPTEIISWCSTFRAGSRGVYQLNTWIPDPPPERHADEEARVRSFLKSWGPEVPADAGDAPVQDFAAQCEAMLAANPTVISSIMGVYPPPFVEAMKARGIAWFACATTVSEARMAEEAGADVIVAQGAEAGGHRGAFEAGRALRQLVGLVSLVPAIVDAVRIPVVATGGIADGRGVAAALALGASAVQIGTRFLRSSESGIHPAWAAALGAAAPEDTTITRAFSGRPGRSLATSYVEAMASADAPEPAPYPVQRALTAPMRAAALRDGDVGRMQAWAGQSAALAESLPARDVVATLWQTARELLA